MNKTHDNKLKGNFSFQLTPDQLKEFRNTTAEERLNWLEEANEFVETFVSEDIRRRWEKWSKG